MTKRKASPLFEVCTISEAAAIMGLSESSVLKYCQAGRLEAREVMGDGRKKAVWLVLRSAAQAWVSDPPGPKPRKVS